MASVEVAGMEPEVGPGVEEEGKATPLGNDVGEDMETGAGDGSKLVEVAGVEPEVGPGVEKEGMEEGYDVGEEVEGAGNGCEADTEGRRMSRAAEIIFMIDAVGEKNG